MESILLWFNGIKPLSTNQTKNFTRDGRYYPSPEKTKFRKEIAAIMPKYFEQITQFDRDFDVKTEFLKLKLVFYVPMSRLITKKGAISLRSIDLDNCQKTVIDCVFNCFSTVDDKSICDIQAFKRPSLTGVWGIGMVISKGEIVDLERKHQIDVELTYESLSRL
jgi:Holliday junction resolvase RusA-like endonuclease